MATPKIEREKQKRERLGQELYNNSGLLMKIIRYNSEKDIDIYFPEYDWITCNKRYSNFVRGKVNCPYDKKIYGIGFMGEGPYKSYSENKKITKQYCCWHSMMSRCYDPKFLKKNITYTECSVCEEWHNFQTFAQWYEDNYYEVPGETMELDKDILVKGNKIYSPNTCCFVPHSINTLFVKADKIRGDLPIGVSPHKCGKYQARGKDDNHKYAGIFNTIEEAFQKYKEVKEENIKEIADDYYSKGLIPHKLYEAMYNYEVEIDD